MGSADNQRHENACKHYAHHDRLGMVSMPSSEVIISTITLLHLANFFILESDIHLLIDIIKSKLT